MDPRRARTERNMLPQVGPQFFREGEAVLFQFVIDPGNVLGPRPARREDQANHPGAWAEFCASDGVSALDRDASGEDGGSLPSSESPEVVAVETTEGIEADKALPPPVMAPPREKRKYTRRQKVN